MCVCSSVPTLTRHSLSLLCILHEVHADISKHYIIGHAMEGPGDNCKVSRDSVVVLEESPRHRAPTYKSLSSDFKALKIFEDMHSADKV